MAGQPGKDLNVQWLSGGGTTVLTGDFRTFSYTPSIDMIEDTAGADTHKHYIPGLKSGQVSMTYIHQSGGSVTLTALVPGTEGTLIWSEEGTASGKPKHTAVAISQGAATSHPYTDLVEVSISFQLNGAVTDGSN